MPGVCVCVSLWSEVCPTPDSVKTLSRDSMSVNELPGLPCCGKPDTAAAVGVCASRLVRGDVPSASV
jgi:hypothetical protein